MFDKFRLDLVDSLYLMNVGYNLHKIKIIIQLAWILIGIDLNTHASWKMSVLSG